MSRLNTALVLTILKILPLAIYLRAAACKYNVPILGCDAPLCPVAIGKKGDCTPTANTAEIQARSIHWSPYDRVGVVNAKNNYELAKILGLIEVIGYVLLWKAPQLGGFILTIFMAGAIHFHLAFLKDKPEALVLQFALLAASIAVMMLSPKNVARKKKRRKTA
ncbi:uncharacterized protein MICPUCDRAFT_38236 [Micromonas pusilla CCMP1545]|uniref:Predicted protein n=1 Tax=Micromonas pusilla (strain CCMP1545) TaxID=564608 RepID=C1MJ54_MICPC|nr:uncharacterized protein MICPUCDRAFT_38236 [Micromonas pusilla CCMP1545]EEH60506.1 predicted protein [Micromonas pusilla CCMP1545]|eukprot:XP_003055254.1 predicted protein [Micromonas pusilla CCMP1545]